MAATAKASGGSFGRPRAGAQRVTEAAQSASAKVIGKGLMTIALVIIVLNQLFTLDVVNNTTGPFSGLITQIQDLGSAALLIVTLGFLILGASVAMGYMDRF